MARRFKIHPGIGIARLGNSPAEFFVGPEMAGAPGIEIGAGGENPVASYKDVAGRLKRQGARFRVFEYAVDASGTETLVGEITPAQARVTWKVSLANTKGAGPRILGSSGMRNASAPRAEVSITPTFPPISGQNAQVTEATVGKFKGQDVSLGQLRTDGAGRLIVLGGQGTSKSVPAGALITNFANNDGWYDDISDGPVNAELLFPGSASPIPVDKGAWVIVAPPDFAPGVFGLTTLYDIAFAAAVTRGWRVIPGTPSFRADIRPILHRARQLRFVNQFAFWNSFPANLDDLALKGTPQADTLRAQVFDQLMDVEASQTLNNFEFTAPQKAMLQAWRDGSFVSDAAAPLPVLPPPAELDKAALEQAVGGGFFPGIEAGILTANAAIYDEFCRLTRQSFPDGAASITLQAGTISQRMAVPWQADFLKCAGQWWPAQRPDQVFLNEADTAPTAIWTSGISNHVDLAENFWKLGVVVSRTLQNGDVVHVETERNASMPRTGV